MQQTKLLLRVRQASAAGRAARLAEYRLIVRGIVWGQGLTDAGRVQSITRGFICQPLLATAQEGMQASRHRQPDQPAK